MKSIQVNSHPICSPVMHLEPSITTSTNEWRMGIGHAVLILPCARHVISAEPICFPFSSSAGGEKGHQGKASDRTSSALHWGATP
jgi:hypothetical protein